MEVQVTSLGKPSNYLTRYIKPAGFGKIKRSSIHHFVDASKGGYGQSSHDRGEIHCFTDLKIKSQSPEIHFHTKT